MTRPVEQRWWRSIGQKPRSWVVHTIARARVKSAKRSVAFDLTPEMLLPLPTVCPLLGCALIYDKGRGRGANRDAVASLDRIDPRLGYTAGNVWIISYRANTIKSNATIEELELIARGLRARSQR